MQNASIKDRTETKSIAETEHRVRIGEGVPHVRPFILGDVDVEEDRSGGEESFEPKGLQEERIPLGGRGYAVMRIGSG